MFASRADTRSASFAGSDTTAANVDKITDFVGNGAAAGDVITFGTGVNAFGTALTFTGATVASTTSLSVFANDVTQFAANIEGILFADFGGSVASTAATAQIYDVIVTDGNLAGTHWLILNDDNATITTSDTFISITGLAGTINAADIHSPGGQGAHALRTVSELTIMGNETFAGSQGRDMDGEVAAPFISN